jgi:outer membrane protein assembly factor BamB
MAAPLVAGNWPAWRGPGGAGISVETNLPLHWSANRNVRWRAPLPDRGNSTPVVWGERVFITQAVDRENRRGVMCFARRDGRLLWQSSVVWTEKEPTHPDNPACTPSPVTDGERIIAWLGSAGVYCYDLDGRQLWHRDLGRQEHQWGYASSPVLYQDLCLLNFGPGDRTFLIALDKKTGRTVWQFDLPIVVREDLGDTPAPGLDAPGSAKLSEIAGSWDTPAVVPVGGRDELVVTFPLRIMAFDPGTGEQLWSCTGPNIGMYSSTFFGEGLVGVAASGFRNTLMVVRPGGRGNVTATHRLWFESPGQPTIGSGVIFQGRIFLVKNNGVAECRDLRSGKLVWTGRLRGTGARNSTMSSPVLAGDRLYVPNRNADVFVLRAGPKFELLAVNSIGGEPMVASLAVSNGDIFVRTDQSLRCIGAPR